MWETKLAYEEGDSSLGAILVGQRARGSNVIRARAPHAHLERLGTTQLIVEKREAVGHWRRNGAKEVEQKGREDEKQVDFHTRALREGDHVGRVERVDGTR